jgi:hypothetical protein
VESSTSFFKAFIRDVARNSEQIIASDPLLSSIVSTIVAWGRKSALIPFRSAQVIPTDHVEAGFYRSADAVLFNQDAVDQMHRECDALRERYVLDSRTYNALRQLCVELYIAHEFMHITQNLVDFCHVREVKAAAGNGDKIGELDIIADVRAAQLVARVQVLRTGHSCGHDGLSDCLCYAYAFKNAVSVIGHISPKAFGCPPDKPAKVRRAGAIVLIAARTQAHIDGFTGKFDQPIEPWLKDARTGSTVGIHVLQLSGDQGLWIPPTMVSRSAVEMWMRGAVTGEFNTSMKGALAILDEALIKRAGGS